MSALPCRTTTSQEAGYPSLADTWEGVRMFGHQTSSSDRGTSVVQDSLHGFANMLALAAAFLCAGQIWNFTSDPMYHFLMNTYGDASVAELGTYVWIGLASGAVYFLCRALIVLSLILISQRLVFMAI